MDRLHDMVSRLEQRLKGPLPGLEAQLELTSIRHLRKDPHFTVPDQHKRGSVLILFYPSSDLVKLVFIRRPEYPGVHSGQISFPGGQHEAQDTSEIHTALRETREEIGVEPSEITILGTITQLYIPPSNFLVTPVIGYMDHKPEFIPDREEVSQVLELPLEEFIRKKSIVWKEIPVNGEMMIKAPCFYVEDNTIWGATAMMLNEFLALLR